MAMTLIQQQPFFSYTHGCNEALGHSITFGRFMSNSYSFASASDKWSNSSHVEEAHRLCRPGSVAQKKAFFEARKADDPQVGAQGSQCTVDVTSLTVVEEEIVAAVEKDEIVAVEQEIFAAVEEDEIVPAVEEEEIVVVECSSQILKEQLTAAKPISKKPPKSVNFTSVREIKRIIKKIHNCRVQLQTTLKGKAEAELKKLRQSLCFKARPPPKVLQTNQIEKVPNMVQATAQPPQRSSFKNGGSKHATRKNNKNTQLRSKYSK
ncbi:uncharacterized protein [Euphorbia lathyris]|uniref:uncharacterized protein n=1 Tax=Euphorbia lathyris TaxID=212925 RepID=UPI0033134A80